MVDFASIGVGLGMSDVAMHIHHAVRPEDLANGGEEELWDHYYNTLCALLQPAGRSYPRDVALRHYRLAVCDYFRFFLGRFWKLATPESMEKKANSQNTALINRSVDSALAFLRRVEKYLAMIEKERETLLRFAGAIRSFAGGVAPPQPADSFRPGRGAKAHQPGTA